MAPPGLRFLFAGAERVMDRVLCAAGAVLFSQAPEFMQQYLQRLEGHLDEARLVVRNFQEAAARSGMTLDQLLAGAASNPDPSMARLGSAVRESAARVGTLESADAAIRAAGAWARPFVFLGHLDPSIARATLSIYRPAVPTTAEGLCYAAAGIVVMLAAYHLGVRRPIARRLERRRQA
ncbi:MAG TPA: DUF2937 family protein [Opitutaceae bacterium]